MQNNTTSPRLYELVRHYPFLELHEGGLPYDPHVLSQESVLQGSTLLIFPRLMDWLGEGALSEDEAQMLLVDFWMKDPEFLLQALAQCPTAKGVVVDEAIGAYYYLLTADGGQLREELTRELREMVRQARVHAVA